MIYTAMISSKAKTVTKDFTLSGTPNRQQAKQIAKYEASKTMLRSVNKQQIQVV